MSLIKFFLVNRDAGIRANDGTRCASDAGIGHIVAIGVSPVVYLVLRQCQCVCRAGHNTQVASFATFFVNDDGSSYFAHNIYNVLFPFLLLPRRRMREQRRFLFRTACFLHGLSEIFFMEGAYAFPPPSSSRLLRGCRGLYYRKPLFYLSYAVLPQPDFPGQFSLLSGKRSWLLFAPLSSCRHFP